MVEQNRNAFWPTTPLFTLFFNQFSSWFNSFPFFWAGSTTSRANAYIGVKSILWLSKSLLSSVFFCLVATIPKNVTFSVAFHSQETEHILGYHQKSNWPSLPKVLLSPQFSSSCYSKSFLPLKLQYSSFFFDVLTTLQLNFGKINLVCTESV